jgi:hypothetical protein
MTSSTTRRTDVFGTPGSYALTLARTAMLRAALYTAGMVLSVVASLWVLTGTGWPVWVAVLPGLLVSACVAAVRSSWSRAEKAYIGMRSEKTVAAAILGAGPDVVVHGALLGAGGDCDHAVLGPVVAVVETKTGTGKVVVTKDGLRAGRRTLIGDPVAQARKQAAALGKKSGMWAEAVVCITEMTNDAFEVDGVVVCSPSELPMVLARMPRICTPDAARRTAYAITPRP